MGKLLLISVHDKLISPFLGIIRNQHITGWTCFAGFIDYVLGHEMLLLLDITEIEKWINRFEWLMPFFMKTIILVNCDLIYLLKLLYNFIKMNCRHIFNYSSFRRREILVRLRLHSMSLMSINTCKHITSGIDQLECTNTWRFIQPIRNCHNYVFFKWYYFIRSQGKQMRITSSVISTKIL